MYQDTTKWLPIFEEFSTSPDGRSILLDFCTETKMGEDVIEASIELRVETKQTGHGEFIHIIYGLFDDHDDIGTHYHTEYIMTKMRNAYE